MEHRPTHNRRRLGPVTAGLLYLGVAVVGIESPAIVNWIKQEHVSSQANPDAGKTASTQADTNKDKTAYAKPDDVQKAVRSLQNQEKIRCPEDARYRMTLDPKDPTSVICLDTGSMKTDAKGVLVVRLVMGPNYGKLINLGASLSKQKEDDCDNMTQRLTSYTDDLLRQTNAIPSNQAINIGLITGAQIDTPCYVYSEAVEDPHIVKPE